MFTPLAYPARYLSIFFSRLNRTSWQRYSNPLLKKTAERRQRRLPSFKPSFLTNGVYSSLTNHLVLPSHKERPRTVRHRRDVLWNQASLASTLGTQVGHGVGESVGHHGTSRSRHLLCNLAVLIFVNIMEKKTFSVSLQMFIHCPKD